MLGPTARRTSADANLDVFIYGSFSETLVRRTLKSIVKDITRKSLSQSVDDPNQLKYYNQWQQSHRNMSQQEATEQNESGIESRMKVE